MFNSEAIFGCLSAVFVLAGFIPYIYTVIKGHTKPERSAWWIWTALMLIALAAQYAQGARWSLILTGSFLICNLLIAILSVKRGYGHFNRKDTLACLATIIGLAAWSYTKNPLTALLITMAVDFIGNWLIIAKSWHAPYTENVFTWFMVTIATVFSLLAVGGINDQKAIFPVYEILVNGSCLLVIYERRNWRSRKIRAGIKSKHAN